MKKLSALLALALAAAPLTAPRRDAHAGIESLDLRQMMKRCDAAVYGEIVAREVFFVAEEQGPGLYFTRLTLAGATLREGVAIEVDVLHAGGILDAEHGVYNSEAPSADDTAVGTHVVAFYKWSDDMGGGVAGNALYAAHGGLYRAVEGPAGTVALGRGASFAVASNTRVGALASAVRALAAEEER
jgi:hypothetical protein